MALRVAAASSDGKTIDLHFGEADSFYIYDFDGSGFSFVEKRGMERYFGHNIQEFDKVSLLLCDCGAVLVAKIGPRAAQYLLSRGLRVFETPYQISAVLDKLKNAIP
jgi:predicted Fe-Mo cluster-binding NifX family protein